MSILKEEIMVPKTIQTVVCDFCGNKIQEGVSPYGIEGNTTIEKFDLHNQCILTELKLIEAAK